MPNPTSQDAVSAATQAVTLEHDTSGADFIIGSNDFGNMEAFITADMRASVLSKRSNADDVARSEETDLLGYWLTDGASDETRALTLAVAEPDADTEQVETVCVVASELLHALERDGTSHETTGPLADKLQLMQTLTCVAAHPNASPRAIRQAVVAEGKYSAREVLRRSRDPEMLEFALDNADVGPWYAASEAGKINPALMSHRLDELIAIVHRRQPDPDNEEYHANFVASLHSHPNLTGTQRTALGRRRWRQSSEQNDSPDSVAHGFSDYMDVLILAANGEIGDSGAVLEALEDDSGAAPPRAEPDLLENIAVSADDEAVRDCALWHPNMDVETLASISAHDSYDESLRSAARERLREGF